MSKFIFSEAHQFTTVSDVFSEDEFIARHFTKPGNPKRAKDSFLNHTLKNSKMSAILKQLSTMRNGLTHDRNGVPIVDCGVFMGIFSIAMSVLSEKLQIKTNLSAFEANPLLERTIRENFDLYGADVDLHMQGIGDDYTSLEFVYRKGGLIDGTVFNTAEKKQSDFETVQCDVIPLGKALPASAFPGLVKIDIEGNEPNAFRSIMNDKTLLSNVFIVEFAPWQSKVKINDQLTFGEFLLQNFNVLNMDNWMSKAPLRHLEDLAKLDELIEGQLRKHNTDLLLIPRCLPEISATMLAYCE